MSSASLRDAANVLSWRPASVEACVAEEGGQDARSGARRLGRFRLNVSDAALNWIALGVLVVVWGSAFAAISIGVETISPYWMVAGRLVFGAMFIGVWLAGRAVARGGAAPATRTAVAWPAIGWFSLVGIAFTAIPFVMYGMAAESIDSAVLAISNGGTPFFTAIFAHAFIAGDKLTPRRAIGVGLGFAGLGLLVGPEAMKGAGGHVGGLALGIIGAALYAGGNVATRLAPHISPVVSTLILSVAGGAFVVPVAIGAAPFPVDASLASIIAVIFLALGPTAMAMILYVWLIQRAGPVFVSFSTYLSPLWAAGIGVLFLDEPVSWSMAAALGLIFTGVAIASRRPRGG
jgi:drug/metabolite transporter (DMT)-like permease